MDRKKQLKEAYKLNPPAMGVYQIKNNANHKILVGSSMNLKGKQNSTFFQLHWKSHPIKELQADWNLGAPANFSFEVLEILKTEDLSKESYRKALLALEEKWLERLEPYGDKGYNKRKI